MRLLITSLLFVFSGLAHRSLPDGVTCGNQFATPDDALLIPDTKISWANYRLLTCDAPVLWAKGEMDADQNIEFTVGLPVLERFRDVQATVVVIGMGLTPPDESTRANLPKSVADNIADGEGVAIFESPLDQSTCNHLKSEEMQKVTDVVDERCHFSEEFSGSENWVLIDENMRVPEAGEYRFALYTSTQTTAKIWFACCDWPEDFTTPYQLPVAECPYCGTEVAKNPGWISHFYEHKSMAQYGGFPPMESCVNNSDAPSEPENCPPENKPDDSKPQKESCRLGCTKGECHSHNIFGECSYDLDWAYPNPRLGEADVSNLILFKGDSIKVSSQVEEGQMPYNLFRLASEEHFDSCDFSGAIEVAGVEDLQIGKKVTFANAGTHYFAAGIGCIGQRSEMCQCDKGLKLSVEVKDASEGMRCHKHGKEEHTSGTPSPREETQCLPGMQLAHCIGDQDFGSTAWQCSEFCAPKFLFQITPDMVEGGCKVSGYAEVVKDLTMNVPGSPVKIGVTLYEKADGRRRLQAQFSCADGDVLAYLVGDEGYGASEEQCSEFCTPPIALQFMPAETGSCEEQGYPEFVAFRTVKPAGSPFDVEVRVLGKSDEGGDNDNEGDNQNGGGDSNVSETCHCHSYEEIACDESGEDLYVEHIDEIMANCMGIVSGEDEVCPYLCFQPFEVLHLYYRECDSRPVNELYKMIAATDKCHKAASPPSEMACEDAPTPSTTPAPTLNETPLEFESFEEFKAYLENQESEDECEKFAGRWKNGACRGPKSAKKVKCKRLAKSADVCEAVGCKASQTKKGNTKCKGKPFN